VVGYDYEHDSEGNVTKYPVVRFRAPDGRLVTARPDFGGDSVHEIGDNVDVLFDPDRPEEAHLDTRASNLFTSEAVVAGWVLIVGPLVAVTVWLIIMFRDPA
jgi:hypothetical protein